MNFSFKIFVVMLLFLLAACTPKQNFKNVEITDSQSFGKDFHLEDSDGAVRTLADFRGKVVVMFFGYTYCPDYCPTTLTEIHRAMNALGAQADKVQVLFVTFDPARDTSSILKQYASAFDPR